MGKNKHGKAPEEPHYTDEELKCFTVSHRRSAILTSKILSIVIFLAVLVLFASAIKNGDKDLRLISGFNLVVWPFLIVAAYLQDNQKLDVKDEILTYTNFFGKSKEIKSFDIRYIEVSYSGTEAKANLYVYDMDDVRLFKVDTSMTNYDMLSEYLSKREYHIELRRRNIFKHLSR